MTTPHLARLLTGEHNADLLRHADKDRRSRAAGASPRARELTRRSRFLRRLSAAVRIENRWRGRLPERRVWPSDVPPAWTLYPRHPLDFPNPPPTTRRPSGFSRT